MKAIKFNAIVETGTFRGTTTEYFAETGLPVYTVEIHPRCYGYSSMRFRGRKDQIRCVEGDSPDFLNDLVKDKTVPKLKVFFYLDAHVQDASQFHKAPLDEELRIIFNNWREAVVLVDDFKVPGTTYSFDDWGPGKTLSVECLEDAVRDLKLHAFYPSLDPKEETGAKRGWVVFGKEENVVKLLSEMPELTTQPGKTENLVKN